MNSDLKLSQYVSLMKISKDYFCLNHSLTQQIVFGDENLKNLFRELRSGVNARSLKVLLRKFYSEHELRKIEKFLIKENFLLKPSKELPGNSKFLEDSNKPSYKLLRILLADVCNLNCEYCKVMSNLKPNPQKASDNASINKAVKLFFSGSEKNEEKAIHITGGEPLLFWDKVKYLVYVINKNKRRGEKLMVVIGTNGLLLNDEKIDFIKKNNIKIIISLDGINKTNKLRKLHNGDESFSFADKAISLMSDSKIDFGISMVIGKHNYLKLSSEIEGIIKKYNPKSLGVNYMKPPTQKQSDYPYLIKPSQYVNSVYSAYKAHRDKGVYFELVYRRLVPFVERKFRHYDCGATAGTTINLNAQGKIGPCKSFLVLDKISEKEENNNKYVNRDVLSRRSPIYLDECSDCEAIAICGNGCAYNAWVKNGDIYSIDEDACRYTKLFYKKFVEDLFNIIKPSFSKNTIYIPNKSDRKKMYGKIKINKLNLNSSIGHEI